MKRFVILFLALLCVVPTIAAKAQPPIPNYSLSQNENLYWPLFKRGKRSEKVRVLQSLLVARGSNVDVDGIFGTSTENSVRIFQKSQKIKVDGTVGAQTWESLVVPLRRGSRGAMVRTFQMLLNQNGYRVKQDGVFGAATEKAVRNYQKKEMIADGRASKWVWCWLLGGMNISD